MKRKGRERRLEELAVEIAATDGDDADRIDFLPHLPASPARTRVK